MKYVCKEVGLDNIFSSSRVELRQIFNEAGGYLLKVQDIDSFSAIAKHASKMYFYLYIKYEDIYDLLQI